MSRKMQIRAVDGRVLAFIETVVTLNPDVEITTEEAEEVMAMVECAEHYAYERAYSDDIPARFEPVPKET